MFMIEYERLVELGQSSDVSKNRGNFSSLFPDSAQKSEAISEKIEGESMRGEEIICDNIPTTVIEWF